MYAVPGAGKTTIPPRYGPADANASQGDQHSRVAPFFNNEFGYLVLPFPLLGLPPDLCPQDGLLGFPRLEQILARLLNSTVAPSTGVSDLLEVRSDEGVPRPELAEATALLALTGVGSGRIHFRGVVLAQARLHP